MAVLVNAGFFEAMGRLTPKEQASCTEFLVKFHENQAHPGISLERLSGKGALWSGRVTQDLRAILHQEGDAWVVLHVDHHDPAYRWAERRDVGRHPVTGALQVVEVRETVVEKKLEKRRAAGLFDDRDDAYLASLGVPPSWIPALRQIVDEDGLLEVGSRLPEDVFDRLLRLSAGELVTPPTPVPTTRPLEAAAGGSQGFYVVTDAGDLSAVLAAPLDRWIAFLHPSQRSIVEASPKGAVKVTGSAGTGKTVVAMHRARQLARRGQRVLLTSFVSTLCENLQRNLRKLCTKDELARITVSTIDKQALALARKVDPKLEAAVPEQVKKLVAAEASRHPTGLPPAFVVAEWDAVVDAQGLASWPQYRAASRTGRGRALSVTERKALWQVYGNVLVTLEARHEATWSIVCRRAADALASGEVASPFDAVIVDELQDLRPTALRFVRALAGDHPEGLMLVGDAGQRIYGSRSSLSSLGIDVRGRSHVLRINYRTTEQIRRAADRIAAQATDDLDEGTEDRSRTRSLLRGPSPTFAEHLDRAAELADAVRWVKECRGRGLAPEDIAIFARTGKRADETLARLSAEGIAAAGLDDEHAMPGAVQVGTMHRAKGLEFKAVLVVDAGAEALPSPGLLRAALDPQDRDNALARERQLLYVAMTRARDLLRLTWTGKPSPFLLPVLPASGGPS